MLWFKKRAAPSWKFRAPEEDNGSRKKVWRLLPGSGVLVAELRDETKKRVEFSGIDIISGTVLWQKFTLAEPWWVTFDRIYRDVLFIHQFVRPDMPHTMGIFAVDLFTGKLIWENSDCKLLAINDDVVYGLRDSFQGSEVIGMNYKSGEEMIRFSFKDPQVEEFTDETEMQYLLPEPLEDNAQIKSLLADIHSPLMPNLISLSDKIILGFYIKSGFDEKGIQLYDSHIRVTDPVGKVLYDDVTDKGVHIPMNDFYFVVGSPSTHEKKFLIYVKESVEIVSFVLE
ncbi:MAG: DUF4905 domain-containing protein [Candidatus Kryptoniota bacterium]